MVSPTGERPTLRTAHFLNPSASIDGYALSFLLNSPTQESPQLVTSRSLRKRFSSKAGIYEAIMGSTYEIKQNKKLILGFAERWSPETNTFIFTWSEATITLEDVMVCGGYSVLGGTVSSLLKSKNLVVMEQKLQEAHRESATLNSIVSTHKAWMDYFMGTGHEILHEAFLSLCFGSNDVNCDEFASSNAMNCDGLLDKVLHVYAPLQFVQLWIWERCLALRPIPNRISISKPRVAAWWHDLRFENVGEQWIPVGSPLDEQSQAFARFLRVSELVGGECIEQYLPRSVAMQFGLDQDIPASFAWCHANRTTAWRNYNRPINDAKLDIPPRPFESDISTRYSDCWRGSCLAQYDAVNTFIRRQMSSRTCQRISVRNKEYDGLSIPPGLGMKDKVLQNVSEGNKIDRTNAVAVQTSNGNDRAVRRMEPEPVPEIKEEVAEQIDRKSGIKDRRESSSLGEVEESSLRLAFTGWKGSLLT
ncbi:hypothetical protein SLEP1_g26433 [Rubroshorea leprosula]|uniref:Aminotransferase-like plant mobile domain-containing protein n=1 Tax=Rubroshorea leprosula TaxID=152421 RepID=A0AAV5JM79_9ROSI|nr:hypothetical protein SLEP1_g26433 [Rubroshorea leprosula]